MWPVGTLVCTKSLVANQIIGTLTLANTSDSFNAIYQNLEKGVYCKNLTNKPQRVQTWGGAGAIVRYPLESSANLESSSVEVTGLWKKELEILETVHAGAVGRLYRDLAKAAAKDPSYNYLSKLAFWGKLTKAGRTFVALAPSCSCEDLLKYLTVEAEKVLNNLSGENNE